MSLKSSTRKKSGKEPRSWSVVKSRRIGPGVGQRHVPCLGEINDSQRAAWQKAIEVFDEHDRQTLRCAISPADRTPPAVQVQPSQLKLSRPRSQGAWWLADQLWNDLQLDTFFAARLGCSREGTDWEKVLRLLTLYRLLSPGSQWRLHRHWFATTARAIPCGSGSRRWLGAGCRGSSSRSWPRCNSWTCACPPTTGGNSCWCDAPNRTGTWRCCRPGLISNHRLASLRTK